MFIDKLSVLNSTFVELFMRIGIYKKDGKLLVTCTCENYFI